MSKGEPHKKHHYVPQTYLKQFAHTNGKVDNPTYFLNACNRKAAKPYTVNVEDICQIPHFYRISEEYITENPQDNLNPLSLEVEHFAENVETNFTSILEEILRRKERCVQLGTDTFPMLENDKYLLAEQIIIQFLRHPKVRKSDLDLFDDFYPKMLRLFQEGLAIELNNPGIAELQIGIKKDDAVLHAKHTYLNDEILTSFTNDLSKNLWTFVYSPENLFMTSDNPVVCVQQFQNERPLNLGLNQKGAIKFFAIFPDLLLIMMDEKITPGVDCKFGLATDDCIKAYHNALLKQSDIVFSYNPFDNNINIYGKTENEDS